MSRRKEPAIPNELLDQLLAGGAASAAFEQGGLLDSLKKALTECALNAEMEHYLAGEDGAGDMRNGYGRKTVMTDTGKLAIDVPRDRQSSFDPQLIAKYQRRFPGFDDKIVSMYARGMSTREITRHLLAEVVGEQVAAENAKATTKVQRGIVRDCLSGTNGRVKRDSWVPRWMAFPASSYTDRGGVGSAERAQRLAAQLAMGQEPEEVEPDDPVNTDAEDTPVVEGENGMLQAA